jgi:hypothetical protein
LCPSRWMARGASCATVRARGRLRACPYASAPVIVLTLSLSHAAGKEHSLFAGKVIITVHPPIPAGDADKMCAQAQAAVESALAPQFRV